MIRFCFFLFFLLPDLIQKIFTFIIEFSINSYLPVAWFWFSLMGYKQIFSLLCVRENRLINGVASKIHEIDFPSRKLWCQREKNPAQKGKIRKYRLSNFLNYSTFSLCFLDGNYENSFTRKFFLGEEYLKRLFLFLSFCE